MGTGAPDYVRNVQITVPSPTEATGQEVVPRPTGVTRTSNSATTNNTSMTEIVAYTPASGYEFQLTKIICSCETAHHVQVYLDTEKIGDYWTGDKTTIIDWFAWDTKIVGDGSKKVYIQAQADATGATVYGHIIGELIEAT